MKQYWENLHPEFTNFNEKQLTEQGTFVESKGLQIYKRQLQFGMKTTLK